MLPKYVFALGGTSKIKEFIDWIKQTEETRDFLIKKSSSEEHKIGEGGE